MTTQAFALAVALVLAGALAAEGQPVNTPAGGAISISADRVIDNPDSTVTFIHPWLPGTAEYSGERLGIRRGVPGACRLFGLDDFLRGQVVWSKDMGPGVSVGENGALGTIEPGYYIESMTCMTAHDYVPAITVEAIDPHADGSVTVRMPLIHTGMQRYPIVSGFSAGACRLLGYNSAIPYSQEWSEQQVAGVSMGFDGQIYDQASGTYLMAFRCKSKPREKYSSPGRERFEERVKAWRD